LYCMHINLDPWQKKFIETKGDKILCCGRQVGKTEICAIDAAEYALNPDNPHPILMTAPTERQARLLFDKTLRYLMDYYPKKVITKGRLRPTQTKINLTNKMTIYCLPTGQFGLGIRGLTIGRSYEDENSRVALEIEEAIAPMLLTTGGARIKLSTPHGATGEFYNTWINKDGAYNSYTRFSITSETVIRDRKLCDTWTKFQREAALKLIEQAKSRMSTRQYAQEFLGEFVDDLHRWFSDDLIDRCCTLKRSEILTKKANYFLGVDIARMGEDSSTFQVFMRTPYHVYHIDNIVTNKKLTTDTERKILELDRKYNFKRIYIDAGSGTLGVSIFDHLYPLMKKRIKAINNAKRIIEYNPGGEPTMAKLQKEDLYDNLRALMEQRRISLLDDDEVKFELASVQYEYVKKEGQPTKLRIFAVPSADVVEGMIRGAWCVKERLNKFRILYM